MVKEILLSGRTVCLVDDIDFEWLSESKWSDDGNGYAIRRVRDGRNSTEKMHRLITGAKDGEYVDHINGNPWDNRRENLRITTNQQNCSNRRLYSNNTAGYKGVSPYTGKLGKYTAQITYNYKKYHLGVFESAREAALAYNEAALEFFGEYARLNDVVVGELAQHADEMRW